MEPAEGALLTPEELNQIKPAFDGEPDDLISALFACILHIFLRSEGKIVHSDDFRLPRQACCVRRGRIRCVAITRE